MIFCNLFPLIQWLHVIRVSNGTIVHAFNCVQVVTLSYRWLHCVTGGCTVLLVVTLCY